MWFSWTSTCSTGPTTLTFACNKEVLEEVKAVRREMKEKHGVVEPARRVELLTC